ncbi:methylthioribulose 1-phosphate dehydratase [Macrococcus equipercicus]|uniref:Methylthioribulose-1-phosphate dehydratase n=1 Tax=Macrococcus equipercicus TaxID=69967 RepID=A0A9Q9F3J7_9STAP|nr:methylthioribulose 1-phosphate dehydratase [Macrococcus equipercicus]UTH14144.1 methylthioribulose 1-phosphate dehydratase [Macrococcus equipercicus]
MIIGSQPWNELAAVKQRLADRGWFPGTSGNLAVRYDSDSLLVTTSGIDKYDTTDDSFVHVTNNGEPIDTSLRPSLETLLHLQIFEKTNAGCSLHVHTVNNNVISSVYKAHGNIRFKNQELIKAFGLWEETDELVIPIIDNPADIPTLAALFEPHIRGDKGAILIWNHGINVWGKDAAQAFKLLEAAEFLFDYQLKLNQANYYNRGVYLNDNNKITAKW